MDALLILSGLLLIVLGMVWLVSLAFGTSLFWGVGVLALPPVSLLYVVRHWATVRKALLLSALGFIPLIAGASLLASQSPERLAAIVSLEWLHDEADNRDRLAIKVQGQLDGRPFNPHEGELTDGVLTLREGNGFFANKEVSIRLPHPVTGALRLDVLPQDAGVLPDVEISWKRPEQELPEARRLSHGYTLHLDLQPVAPNRLVGDFHLVLPPRYSTNLSGKVELYTDGLRYRAGKVDASHDSYDTLVHVTTDYLQRRHATRQVQVEAFPPVRFPATALQVNVQAQVNDQQQAFELNLSKGAHGWTVVGDEYPALPAESEVASQPTAESSVAAEQTVAAPATALRVDRRQRFSMERLLRDPSHYRNLLLRARTTRGGVAEGRFVGIDQDGNLNIRRVIAGPGEARYNLAPAEIASLELLEP